ncbi:MAG: hypothetical protein ACE5EX_07870 [Phycisphaerae bacterium]
MTATPGRFPACYLRLIGGALAVALLLCGIGYFPTVRLAGPGAVRSLAVGCGVSWLASCVGAIPVARMLTGQSDQPATAILASTGLRFVAVLAGVVPLTLSGWFQRNVFVLWVGISYLVLLLVDTILAVNLSRRDSSSDS